MANNDPAAEVPAEIRAQITDAERLLHLFKHTYYPQFLGARTLEGFRAEIDRSIVAWGER